MHMSQNKNIFQNILKKNYIIFYKNVDIYFSVHYLLNFLLWNVVVVLISLIYVLNN
jgi:hypothetical protein